MDKYFISLPFSSYDSIMIVAVDGTGKKHDLGLRDVLYNFRYLCQRNRAGIRRPAAKHIGFYVSGGPKAIVYWAIVDNIVESSDNRCYNIESIMRLNRPIPLGTIPPNFSGGGVEIPLEKFFNLRSVEDIYGSNEPALNRQDLPTVTR